MRRNRHPAAARAIFHRALGIFDGLGATMGGPATAELAASGVKDRRVMMAAVGPNRLDELSPQEFQVARIAARGQNNNEVAAALVCIPQDSRGASDEGLPKAGDPVAHRTGPDPVG
jgi:hypothetical protein